MRSPIALVARLLLVPSAVLALAAIVFADPRTADLDEPAQVLAPPAPGGSYLIITNAPMNGAFHRFAAWKRRQGVDAHVLEMSAIRKRHPEARDEAERVRLAIRDAHAAGVRWVLLGGDTDVIPTRMVRNTSVVDQTFASDLYFAGLEGNWDADGDGIYGEGFRSVSDPGDDADLIADVFLGRAPVRSAREAMAFVEKTIQHEERTRSGEVVIAASILPPVGIDLRWARARSRSSPRERVTSARRSRP